MSFRGRFIIDRIKRGVGKWFKMPVPPYELPNYWEGVYHSLGPDDVFEWADVSCNDVRQYTYRPLRCDEAMTLVPDDPTIPQAVPPPPVQPAAAAAAMIETTLEETLGLVAGSTEDQPVLILGCGNSKFGEDLMETGLASPVIQIDVSQRVVETLSIRCREALQTGDMLILQDDATVLSAIPDASCQAAVDKGLTDGLFCADAYQHCWEVLHSVHRVLRAEGQFVIFSFSKPEFLLRKLMIPDPNNLRYVQQWQKMWSRVECRQSNFIYLYRFTKAGYNHSNVQKVNKKARSR